MKSTEGRPKGPAAVRSASDLKSAERRGRRHDAGREGPCGSRAGFGGFIGRGTRSSLHRRRQGTGGFGCAGRPRLKRPHRRRRRRRRRLSAGHGVPGMARSGCAQREPEAAAPVTAAEPVAEAVRGGRAEAAPAAAVGHGTIRLRSAEPVAAEPEPVAAGCRAGGSGGACGCCRTREDPPAFGGAGGCGARAGGGGCRAGGCGARAGGGGRRAGRSGGAGGAVGHGTIRFREATPQPESGAGGAEPEAEAPAAPAGRCLSRRGCGQLGGGSLRRLPRRGGRGDGRAGRGGHAGRRRPPRRARCGARRRIAGVAGRRLSGGRRALVSFNVEHARSRSIGEPVRAQPWPW